VVARRRTFERIRPVSRVTGLDGERWVEEKTAGGARTWEEWRWRGLASAARLERSQKMPRGCRQWEGEWSADSLWDDPVARKARDVCAKVGAEAFSVFSELSLRPLKSL
jgi:hypothetical protein